MAELEAAAGGAAVTNTMCAEIFYYLTIPLVIIIHAGFLAYEMGALRLKNVLSSGVKNLLAFAFMIPTFYFFAGGSIGVSPQVCRARRGRRVFPVSNMPMPSLGDGETVRNHGAKHHRSSIWCVLWRLRIVCRDDGIHHGRRRDRADPDRWVYHSGCCAWVLCLGRCGRLGLACRWLTGHAMGRSRFRRGGFCRRCGWLLCTWSFDQPWTSYRKV